MAERIFWTGVSRFHDWSDKAFLGRILGSACEEGVLESLDWVSHQPGQRQTLHVEDPLQVPTRILEFAKPGPDSEIIFLEAGGSAPAPWTLTTQLPPFLPAHDRVWGYGIVSLLFESQGSALSARLIKAFLKTHSPENTEYACIHPYLHMHTLRDSIYKSPVTFVPMFSGVFWANFLGPGHIDLFDKRQLQNMQGYLTKWTDDGRGLFLIMSENIADVQSSQMADELKRLTDQFRKALK